MSVLIKPKRRGPLIIEFGPGEVVMLDLNGSPLDLRERSKVALCRCGASKSKPYCDGAHNRIGFEPEDGS